MPITARTVKNLQVEISDGRHVLIADEPAGFGDDAGPSPYDLLLASLGACTVMTLHLYARRKGWALESVETRLSTRRIHAEDVEACEDDPDARVDLIERELILRGDLDETQRARLAEIADKCPVHRTLTGVIKVQTQVVKS
jgi:putative redox protein